MTRPGQPILTRPSEVRRLLETLDLRPLQTLGQNFLVDANILALLVEAARVGPGDDVLEIGPGLGVLTEALAARARRVLAVEKDRRLEAYLRGRFAETPNVEWRFGDALDLDWPALAEAGFTRLVSNLPYASGSAILVELFRQTRAPERLVVTLQLEVARRLAARPGSPDYGLLSLWSQADYESALVKVVSPTCFYPAPEVRSAVVALSRRKTGLCPPAAKPLFFQLTKRAFGQRRKQLKAIFSGRGGGPAGGPAGAEVLGALAALGVDPTLRPEALDVETWAALGAALQRGQRSWNA